MIADLRRDVSESALRLRIRRKIVGDVPCGVGRFSFLWGGPSEGGSISLRANSTSDSNTSPIPHP